MKESSVFYYTDSSKRTTTSSLTPVMPSETFGKLFSARIPSLIESEIPEIKLKMARRTRFCEFDSVKLERPIETPRV